MVDCTFVDILVVVAVIVVAVAMDDVVRLFLTAVQSQQEYFATLCLLAKD